jgi:hypothetical protein
VTSEYSKQLDTIQKLLEEPLKACGYRKRGRTYNRTCEPGLVHVVNFQSGIYTSSLYGEFTINFGIFVAEIYEAGKTVHAPTFVQEYACAFRARIGEFGDPPGGGWWPVSSSPESVAEEVRDFLGLGLAWLDRFITRSAVLAAALAEPGVFKERRAALDGALMLVWRGDTRRALEIIDRYAEAARESHRPHYDYVRDLAERIARAELTFGPTLPRADSAGPFG